ncbi:hypothetical protein IP84_14000 [beta proteobacterium AAP99]|nr:hypothetical protein IP84_14000 [beta proteobacterium AAP99]
MSDPQQAPGGLSWARFESISADVGSWVWGTVQGAFNEKASLSQIIVDAVIGMIPLVGDVTAARDIIAVVIGLSTEPAKREDKWQWILLVVLIFALIPVIGGVIKGVGRILIRVARGAEALAGAARAAHLAQGAKDIIAFLNRVGVGNAERFLLKLRFAEHQQAILSKLDELIETIRTTLQKIDDKLEGFLVNRLPKVQSFRDQIVRLRLALAQLKVLAHSKIPDAIKNADNFLREVQQYVHSGGTTTARATTHTATAGGRASVTMVDELRALEGAGARRSARGGWAKNDGSASGMARSKVYTPEAGYPDLTAYQVEQTVGRRTIRVAPGVTTFSGAIVNRPLVRGDQVFRVFGPEGVTHGVKVGQSIASGSGKGRPAFWGLGAPPRNARSWREGSAVLDEWNRNGFILVGKVLDDGAIKACTGRIAEQSGSQIGAQFLHGGDKQAMFALPDAVYDQLKLAGEQAILTGKPAKPFRAHGVEWEIRPTGWPDVNGVHGYSVIPDALAIQTARLGSRENANKPTNGQPRGTR